MTATRCPCCGSVVEVDLPMLEPTTRWAAYGGRKARLRPSSAKLLACMLKAAPRAARQGELVTALWSLGDEPDGYLGTFRTQVSYLKTALRYLGWTVVNCYGDGYRLERTP